MLNSSQSRGLLRWPPQLRNYDVTFMIANTLVVAKKYETAPTNYNSRVLEATIAEHVLRANFGTS